MVLELAVSAGCDYLITYNRKDFRGSEQFGIKVITPREFLNKIGAPARRAGTPEAPEGRGGKK